jgi:hypothetical protein
MSESQPEQIINIENIMREIRQQILVEKAAWDISGTPIVATGGKYLPDTYYEHLYHAGLLYGELEVQMHLTPTTTPVIGAVLHRLRRIIHEAVIFYVNKLAARQIEINKHLLRTVSLLGEEVEKMREAREEE